MNPVIIMPVLNPDQKMITFLNSLLEAGFQNIIIVNDGSSEETLHYFEEADQHSEVTILTHDVNHGKGRALKTAFSYLYENRKDIDCAITVDGDGQHNVGCINNCLKAYEEHPGSVVLGGRSFDDKETIPWRSRFGNKMSSKIYRFAIGIKLRDTQTGLRIIPADCFKKFSELKGERYEYETQMLIKIANDNIHYYETPIETIYEDNNSVSHFNPFKDSVKIYAGVLKYFFKFVITSLSSWVVDIGVFSLTEYLLLKYCPDFANSELRIIYPFLWLTVISTLTSRIISSIFNFILNRKTVFKSADNVGQTALRYYILAVCQLIMSMLLVDIFTEKVLGVEGILRTVVKCVVDLALFVLSYTVQHKWVFKNKKD